jgi:hypothetical protein
LGTEKVTAANEIARNVLSSLKSGVLLKGTVHSHSKYGSTNVAWVVIKLPAAGERQVPVKNKENLQLGQEVLVECVPNPYKAERYMFRIAGDPDTSAVV